MFSKKITKISEGGGLDIENFLNGGFPIIKKPPSKLADDLISMQPLYLTDEDYKKMGVDVIYRENMIITRIKTNKINNNMYSELKNKDDKICWEIYRLLFAAASPPADFDELVKNATIDEHGKKHIPFMEYEIDERVMDIIIAYTLKEKKVKKDQWQKFKNIIYLGCSPKTRQNNNMNNTIEECL